MILVCMSAAGCSKGDDEWEPDRERPWNFTPTVSESGSEAYDIEVTLDSESYLSTVDEIRIYVLNKTGETFTLESTGLFIEKYDARAFAGIESTEGWVRLPYYTGVGMYKKG